MTLTTVDDYIKPPTSQISLPVVIGAAVGVVVGIAILVAILVMVIM